MRLFSTVFARYGMALGLLGLASCVEPYVPAVVDAPTNYLVVDGFINGNGRTRIKLSRTTTLAASATPPVEKGAKLFVVDDNGLRYALTERASGSYQSDSLVLNPARQYQLRITTASNVTYESARVPMKVTPAIDNLKMQPNDTQVAVQLSSHDPSGQSRFYRWSFVETWHYTAAFNSNIEYYPVPPPPFKSHINVRSTPIYNCWRTERPSVIKQSSTAQLSQDALTDVDVLTISTRAERLKIRYSVLVNQWAETPEEFAYYELLRKNTEAVGTVNDPLPTQLTGNVHRLDNAAEPVLGFVGAHTMQSKRLFIDRSQLPPHPDSYYDTPYVGCSPTPQYFCSGGGCDVDGVINLFALPENIPLDFIIADPDFGDGILSSSAECADCRLRGSTTKPSFW
jgi:hypothetical protein